MNLCCVVYLCLLPCVVLLTNSFCTLKIGQTFDIVFIISLNLVCYRAGNFGDAGPKNPQELFNLVHSTLRSSAAECGIGLLKNRFRILRGTLRGPLTTCQQMLAACCYLHNYVLQDPTANKDLEMPLPDDDLEFLEEIGSPRTPRVLELPRTEPVDRKEKGVSLRDAVTAVCVEQYIGFFQSRCSAVDISAFNNAMHMAHELRQLDCSSGILYHGLL